MMYRNYKLSHFFGLAFLLVLGIVAFAVYGWRTNAPSNLSQEGIDVSSPFYETPKAAAHGETDNTKGHGNSDASHSEEPAPHGH